MSRFIEGQDRQQVTLLPECLDDFIGEDNPVRVVDAFVAELNLVELGFDRTVPARTGRPAYDPAVLLKVYIYGYLNRVSAAACCSSQTVGLEVVISRRAPVVGQMGWVRAEVGAALALGPALKGRRAR